LELRPRLRNLRESRVDDEADVLERIGSAIEPPAVGERVEGVLRELVLDRLRREDRHDQTVRGEVTRPVVRGDDDVWRVLRLDRLQVVADVSERVKDDVDVDAAS